VARFWVPHPVDRAARVARWTRPDGYHLVVSLGDGVCPGPSGGPLGAGGMLLYDTPWAVGHLGVLAPAHGPHDRAAPPADAVVLHIARHRLPLPPARVEHLLGIGLTGTFGVGAVLVGNLRQVIALANPISEHSGNAVAGAVLDLLGAVLEERLGTPSRTDDERQRALLIGVHTFVEQRLPDPNLSLSQVAAAHHVSLRSLHKLFEPSGTTAAANRTWSGGPTRAGNRAARLPPASRLPLAVENRGCALLRLLVRIARQDGTGHSAGDGLGALTVRPALLARRLADAADHWRSRPSRGTGPAQVPVCSGAPVGRAASAAGTSTRARGAPTADVAAA
jgi:hypothetical protein